jgi:hypothetical protein
MTGQCWCEKIPGFIMPPMLEFFLKSISTAFINNYFTTIENQSIQTQQQKPAG